MVKRVVTRWDEVDKQRVRRLRRRLAESLPQTWGARLDAVAEAVASDVMAGEVPFWRKDAETFERLSSFAAKHGDARGWALDDYEICERAKEIASDLAGWCAGGPLVGGGHWSMSQDEQVDLLRIVCAVMGVDMPVGIHADGVLRRGWCALWWRRALRRRVSRVVEHGAITLGLVSRMAGAYASGEAVRRRAGQLARNRAMLDRTLVKNEAGQIYKLSELAALSVSNPDNRRGELMVRIRGAEEYADRAGHIGVFLTLTCPSRFHAVLSTSRTGGGLRMNPKYEAALTPKDGQQWLCKMWARVRAELARLGVSIYGLRVAEPHHDACPHWHALVWVEDEKAYQVLRDVVLKHWLSDAGDEAGALKNRVNYKRMDAGGAAGYVAKYVAKNVGGAVNVQGHKDEAEGVVVKDGSKGVARVDAWAATWGIRQFQAFGMPSVGVWRMMRGVSADQVEQARVCGDAVAYRAWVAVHAVGNIEASWLRFVDAMGGMCRKRGDYLLTVAKRINEGVVNGYGEAVRQVKAVGVEVVKSGRWLVSKVQAWARVAGDAGDGDDAGQGQSGAQSAKPWTCFNNCTERLTGELRAALMGLDEWRPLHDGDVLVNAVGFGRRWRSAFESG